MAQAAAREETASTVRMQFLAPEAAEEGETTRSTEATVRQVQIWLPARSVPEVVAEVRVTMRRQRGQVAMGGSMEEAAEVVATEGEERRGLSSSHMEATRQPIPSGPFRQIGITRTIPLKQ